MCRVTRLFLLVMCCLASAAVAASPTVFAAASLKPVLDDMAARGLLGTPAPTLVYAASSQLARQIVQGAPADIYISADQQWMDHVEQHGGVAANSRRDLLSNTLVLVAGPHTHLQQVALTAPALMTALATGRLAIALPDSVPAGIYARQALTSLRLWAAVQPKLAPSRDVRAALALVLRGEAPLGVVYGSDARSEPATRIVAHFPDTSHDPIVYPVAIVAGHDSPSVRVLLAALTGPQAAAVFREFGFIAPAAVQ